MRAPLAVPEASCLFHGHRLQRPRTGRSAVSTQRPVQVPHVHVVQNTIETQQLQILEKYVGFPASRSDVTCEASAHVIEHVPVDTCAAPARLAPAPMTECIAQTHVPSYPQFSTGAIFYNLCGGFHAKGYVFQAGPSGASCCWRYDTEWCGVPFCAGTGDSTRNSRNTSY